jgi:hypothetical protein
MERVTVLEAQIDWLTGSGELQRLFSVRREKIHQSTENVATKAIERMPSYNISNDIDAGMKDPKVFDSLD